jgi:hypothetical protein
MTSATEMAHRSSREQDTVTICRPGGVEDGMIACRSLGTKEGVTEEVRFERVGDHWGLARA